MITHSLAHSFTHSLTHTLTHTRSYTHTLNPPVAIFASLGVFILHFLPAVKPSEGKNAVSYIPMGLLLLAALIYLLEPEFEIMEVTFMTLVLLTF